MRKNFYFLIGFLIFSFIFTARLPLHAAGLQATVFLVEGQVSYRQSPTDEWQELRRGQKLSENSHILTSKNSRCEIQFGTKQSAAKLAEDSYVVLESLDPISLKIQSGKIYALARNLKKGSSFQVKTPTVIAAARGTGWIQTEKSIEVVEDVVNVQDQSGNEVDVPAGKGLDILEDGKLGDIREIKNEVKEDWKDFESGNESGGGASDDSKDRVLRDLNNLDRTDDKQSDLKDATELGKDDKTLDELKAEKETGGSYF